MIELTCMECFAKLSLTDFTNPAEPVNVCCHNHLSQAAKLLHQAAAISAMIQFREHNRERGDDLANQCIVSPDPELRQAAIRWRNLRSQDPPDDQAHAGQGG